MYYNVPGSALKEVWGVVTRLVEAVSSRPQPAHEAEEALTTTNLTRTIHEAVAQALQKTSPPKTWAAIAAGASPSLPRVEPPPKAVPSRVNREVLVKGSTIATDFQKRTPEETILAVNHATRSGAAVAARRLRSGDVVITFAEESSAFREQTEWLRPAFGPEASLHRRLFSVIIKSFPLRHLNDITDEALSATNNVKIARKRARRPRNESATRTTLTLAVDGLDDANQLCKKGLVYKAEIFDVEPYEESVHPRQCYKCYKVGHIAKYCEATPRCGHCGATAHESGEETCPVKTTNAPPRCANCNGPHPAWSRACPVMNQHWNKARDAYQHRPTSFAETFKDVHPDRLAAIRRRTADEALSPEAPTRKRAGRPPGSKNKAGPGQRGGREGSILSYTRRSRAESVPLPNPWASDDSAVPSHNTQC